MPNNSVEKIPPQNLEAENAVLGALLIDKEAITKIADSLTPNEFYKNANKTIYEAIIELYSKKEPIDILSLSSKLEEKKQLDQTGGRTYLAELANSVPTSSNISHYAKLVREQAVLRKLLTTSAEIEKMAYENEGKDLDVLLDTAEGKLFSVSQNFIKPEFTPIKSLLNEAFDRIDDLHKDKGKLRGIPTGYKDLDNKLAGLQKSDLIIIAARPSMGKTSLALDIVRQIATKQKIPVGLFSLEMSKEQLIDRMLCAEAGVDLWKMRTGKLSDRPGPMGESDFSLIGHAMGTLSEAPIYIDDTPAANIMEIRTKARRLQSEHGLGLIVIDYLQLMEGRGLSSVDNRVQVVSEISRGLKSIARELSVPLLALSQLSRQVESRHPPIPNLSDLRESGSIEQDADVVMFIYREEYYKKDTNRPHIADILIKKHRNGPTGTVSLFFDMERASFKNLEQKVEELNT